MREKLSHIKLVFLYVHLSFKFFYVILGIFGPGYRKFMKRRVEAAMTIQMTSLTRPVRVAERNCEKKNLRFDAFC